jgi:1,4-dihydroxy-6-naphthoate synthase
MAPADVKGKKIAIPGALTTAYLALKIFEADFQPVTVRFDRVLEALTERTVELALVIHEAQLTYARGGFHRVLDLGAWWKTEFGLPLPLGANALARSLAPEVRAECCRLMRESIQYALDNHDEALNYAMQFARDMDARQAEKFVGMYVNHHTVDAGELIPQAAQKLFDLGHACGLIPRRVEAEFIR